MGRGLLAIIYIATALLLSGCATHRLVDSQVQTFSTLTTLPAPATYRFDRLPSQQLRAEAHSRLETVAADALAQVGLTRDEQAPRYLVQVAARLDRDTPWEPLYGPAWPHSGLYYGAGRGAFTWSPYFRYPPPPSLARREVSIVVRDAASHAVVYETRAAHEGLPGGEPAVLRALLDAALQGFPNPPPGIRRVDTEIPR